MINLVGLKWIGDLSLQDADILTEFAKNSWNILEFGVGGSTQILSQCKPNSIISVETDPKWIELTQIRLEQLSDDRTIVSFLDYQDLDQMILDQGEDKPFDMIFVDGADHLRREFAIKTWKLLLDGGVMIFHDTRRFQDFQNAAWVAQLFHNEISSIVVNAEASDGISSNLTILYKKKLEPYVDWNYVENKPLWAYGGQPNTESMLLWEYKE